MSLFGANNQQGSQPLGSFSFGTNTSAAPTNLTSQTSSIPSLFGTTSLGGGLGTTSTVFGQTQTAPAFSTPSLPTSTTTTSVFSTGSGQTAAPGFSFGAGGFGTTSTAFGSVGVSNTAAALTTTTSSGLGGVDLQASTGSSSTGASNKKDGKTLKECQVPNEITVTVESFKKYVKEQKAVREEMSRVSDQNILKVQELVTTLKQQLSVVSNGIHRNAVAITKLKEESNQELKHAEIAQRTKEALTSMEYESNAPAEYFHNLANNFEKQMQSYRNQIEQLERHLLSLSQPYTLTPGEWTAIRKRLHDTFVTLAAQLQTVHQEVQLYKEQFINSQRTYSGDTRLILEKTRGGNQRDSLPYSHLPASVTYGPSPFAAMQSAAGKAISNVFNSQQLPGGAGQRMMMSYSMPRTIAAQGFSPFKPLGTNGMPSFGSPVLGDSMGFGAADPSQSGLNQKPFQLQKPPVGSNKRGKRWTST